MKKGIAFFLCCLLFLSGWIPLISALEFTSDHSEYDTLRENSITYSCSYDKENGKIGISGTVNHDVMILHSDFLIEVYQILPGQTVSDVINHSDAKPLASAAIAIKFQFSVSATRTSDRFSRYAIVLVSKDGEKILAAEPQYAGIDATYQYDKKDRSGFKGVLSQKTSITGNLGFGTAIVPIKLDCLLSDTSQGYLYPIGDSYRYFDQAYVDALDAQVRTYSASGTRVYLQFLLSSSGTEMATSNGMEVGATYDMPNIFSETVLSLICAFSEFFADRYDSYQNGSISGMIVGSQVDKRMMNYSGEISIQEYAERYAFYVMVVANSARFYQPDLDVVIPLSDVNVYSEEPAIVATGDYSPSALLDLVLERLDATLSVPFPCNILIESSSVPFGISNETLATAPIDMTVQPADTVNSENLQDVLRYVKGQYTNAPEHVMYVWSVPADLSGTALACAYTYTYYRLLQDVGVSTFVVSFLEAERQNSDSMLDIQKIMRYIDTEDSFDATASMLPYFGSSDWGSVVSGLTEEELVFRTEYHSSALTASKDAWLGEFSYFNFSSGDINDWFAGGACKNVKSSYGTDSKRGLSATLQNNARYADVLCLYEYAENFVYTPFVRFTVDLTGENMADDLLYELIITVGNDTAVLTSEYIISGNEPTDVWLDFSQYNQTNVAKYMKISTRVLNGDAEEYTLWLYDVMGVSEEYSSEQLASLIAAERLNIRNQSLENDAVDNNRDLMWMVFGILCAATLTIVVLYWGMHHHRLKKQESVEISSQEDSTE